MRRSRWAAALGALAVQGVLLWVWVLPAARPQAVAPAAASTVVRWVALAPTPARVAAAQPRKARVPLAGAAAAPLQLTLHPAAQSEEPMQAAEAPAAAQAPGSAPALAPPPLRLDGAVLRRAFDAAPSALERQANAAGQSLRNAPASQEEKMGSGMAAASKPECLGPNAKGSLLSIFSIPFDMATGRCK